MPIPASELAQSFVSGAARPCPPDEAEALGPRLLEAVARCQAAWPDVQVAPVAFARHLGTHLPAGEAPGMYLGALCCEDLYVALGALEGDRAALDALERTALGPSERAVRRVDASDAFVDEVRQLTRMRLLVGEGTRGPRLGDYAGRGPLRRWTEAVAVGVAVSLKRRPERSAPLDDTVLAAELGTSDPELEVIRRRYGPAFRAAFAEALAGLSARDRNLLRLSLAQNLGVESLGALHGVHASTVSRWLARARREVLDTTRAGLARRLALDTPQLDSLLRALEGNLEVSFSSLLKEG